MFKGSLSMVALMAFAIWLATSAGVLGNSLPGSTTKHPAKTPTPSPPPDYGFATCSTADIVTMLGKNGALYNRPSAAVQMIQTRIAACKSTMGQYVDGLSQDPIIARNPPGQPPFPTPSPMATVPAGCTVSVPGDKNKRPSNDPIQLYSSLTYCVSWISKNIPSPPSGTPTPQPITLHTPAPGSKETWDKAVYVLALASDPLVSAQIVNQLADKLRSPYMLRPTIPSGEVAPPIADIFSDRVVRYNVVAASGWTLERFQQQCFNDPSTAGAIVALQPGIASQLFSVLFNYSQTFVNLQLMVVSCEPTNTAYVNNAAYIRYVSHVRTKHGVRVSASLATILGGVAIALAFTPTTSTTYTIKPKPVPRGPAYESGYTTSSNSSNAGIASAGVAALTPYNALGEQPSAEQQASTAIENLLPELIDDILWPCTQLRQGDSSFAQPQCDWFPYHRPPSTQRPP